MSAHTLPLPVGSGHVHAGEIPLRPPDGIQQCRDALQSWADPEAVQSV
jgi:hypothetical protein